MPRAVFRRSDTQPGPIPVRRDARVRPRAPMEGQVPLSPDTRGVRAIRWAAGCDFARYVAGCDRDLP